MNDSPAGLVLSTKQSLPLHSRDSGSLATIIDPRHNAAGGILGSMKGFTAGLGLA